MAELELGEVQLRFAELVWQWEPISSGELVKLCERELHWKKPTTHTVLRKLCEKGLLQNSGGTVSSKLSRDAFYAAKSERFVEESFHGSLPALIAAFTARKPLSEQEVKEIQRLINACKKEE